MGCEQDIGARRDFSMARAVYLVIEPDPLLRTDLTETLQFRDCDAVVIAEPSVEAALPQIAAFATIDLALIAAGPREFAASHLAQVIGQRGGRVVLMGERAEDCGEASGFRVLHRPFSENEVLALISDEGTDAASVRCATRPNH